VLLTYRAPKSKCQLHNKTVQVSAIIVGNSDVGSQLMSTKKSSATSNGVTAGSSGIDDAVDYSGLTETVLGRRRRRRVEVVLGAEDVDGSGSSATAPCVG